MKKGITILFIFFSSICNAQLIQPEVFSPAGDFFTGTNFTLSYTVGEIAIIETYTGPNFILTQGFQQPDTNFTTSDYVPSMFDLNFQVYPNPASEQISLYVNASFSGELEIQITNVLSQQLTTRKISCVNGVNVFSFDLSTFANGIYFLNVALPSSENTIGMTLSSLKFVISK